MNYNMASVMFVALALAVALGCRCVLTYDDEDYCKAVRTLEIGPYEFDNETPWNVIFVLFRDANSELARHDYSRTIGITVSDENEGGEDRQYSLSVRRRSIFCALEDVARVMDKAVIYANVFFRFCAQVSSRTNEHYELEVAPEGKMFVNGFDAGQQWRVDALPRGSAVDVSVREPSRVCIDEFLQRLWNVGINARTELFMKLPSGDCVQFVPSPRMPPDLSVPDMHVSDSAVQFLTHGGAEVATMPILSFGEQCKRTARTMSARGMELEMQLVFSRLMNMSKVLSVMQQAKDAKFEKLYLAFTLGVPKDDEMLTDASTESFKGQGGVEKLRILHRRPLVDNLQEPIE